MLRRRRRFAIFLEGSGGKFKKLLPFWLRRAALRLDQKLDQLLQEYASLLSVH